MARREIVSRLQPGEHGAAAGAEGGGFFRSKRPWEPYGFATERGRFFGLDLPWRVRPVVVANKQLLKLIRQAAIRDELLAMRLRSRLVVPPAKQP